MTATLPDVEAKRKQEPTAEEQAAAELVRQARERCLYLVTRSLDPTGRGRARWAVRWKPALNAFSITFADRFPAAETY